MSIQNNKIKVSTLSKYPDMLTVEHLCELLHVGKKSIYGMMRRGELRFVKVGKSYISSKKWLKEFLDEGSHAKLNLTGNYGTIIPVLEFEPVGKETVI